MKLKYISEIQTNLKKYKTIHTDKATSRLLDGSYHSVFKGRSMNFDELREYVAGDEIKDIDWKATARSQRVLVRQYIAEKRHNILFLMDTNKRMLAETPSGDEKKHVATICAGTLGYLVSRNNDYIGSIFSYESGIRNFELKTGLINIETILEQYNHDVTRKNDTNLDKAVNYITRNIRRHMIVVIVTDMEGIRLISEQNLKRLMINNDVLIVCVNDANISGDKVYDIEDGNYLPAFITEDKKLVRHVEEKKKQVEKESMSKVKRCGISTVVVDSIEGLDAKIIELLERHKTK